MRKTRVVAAVTILAGGLARLRALAAPKPTPEPTEGAATSHAVLGDWGSSPTTDAGREAAFEQLQAEAATRPLADIVRERNEAVHRKWAEEAEAAPRQYYVTNADDLLGPAREIGRARDGSDVAMVDQLTETFLTDYHTFWVMDMIGDFEPPEDFVNQYVTGAENGVVVQVVSQSTLTVTMRSWESQPPLPIGTLVIDPKMGEVDVNAINLLGTDQAVLQGPPGLSMVPGGTLDMRGLRLPPAQGDVYQVRVLARYETGGRSVEEVETEWVVEQDYQGPEPNLEFIVVDFWPA